MKTVLYLWLTLATCRLYAQHQDTLALRHLPPDADAIYRFNLPVITSRLSWQEWADRIPLPQQNTSARELAAILREPFRAGVDPDKDIFWTDMTGPAPGLSVAPASDPTPGTPPTDTLHTSSLLLHLVDSSRFTAFLRDLESGIRVSSQDGQCSAGRNGMGAAWNRSLLVLTFITPQSHSHHTTLAIRQSLTMLTGYPDTNRILDPLFLQGFTDDADIDAWTVPGKISSLLLQFLLRLDRPVDCAPLIAAGNGRVRVLTTLRFEKGQVTVKSITPLPHGAPDAWARLIAHPSAATPAPNHILALLNLHINPYAIGDLLDSLHARGQTEAHLFDKGLSLENFVHAFQGDLLLAVTAPDSTGPSHEILTSSPPRTIPDHPSLYAAIPLQDLTAFWQWMDRLKWLTASPDVQDSGHGNIHTIVGRHIPAWLVKDNCLIIAPDHQHALNWCTDTAWCKTLLPQPSPAAVPSAVAPRAADAPLTLRINLKSIAVIPGHTLDQMLFTAGRLNSNKQIENTLQLTLTDSTRNSLRILFRLLE